MYTAANRMGMEGISTTSSASAFSEKQKHSNVQSTHVESSLKDGSKKMAKKKSGNRWTKDEDEILRRAIMEYGIRQYHDKILENNPELLHKDIPIHEYPKDILPVVIRGNVNGDVANNTAQSATKWSVIAKCLPGRIGKQCRERWFNHLDPTLKKGKWSPAEDQVIINLQAKLGNRWCEISKSLPGRSENAIKNRWNSKMRKKLGLGVSSSTKTGKKNKKKNAHGPGKSCSNGAAKTKKGKKKTTTKKKATTKRVKGSVEVTSKAKGSAGTSRAKEKREKKKISQKSGTQKLVRHASPLTDPLCGGVSFLHLHRPVPIRSAKKKGVNGLCGEESHRGRTPGKCRSGDHRRGNAPFPLTPMGPPKPKFKRSRLDDPPGSATSTGQQDNMNCDVSFDFYASRVSPYSAANAANLRLERGWEEMLQTGTSQLESSAEWFNQSNDDIESLLYGFDDKGSGRSPSPISSTRATSSATTRFSMLSPPPPISRVLAPSSTSPLDRTAISHFEGPSSTASSSRSVGHIFSPLPLDATSDRDTINSSRCSIGTETAELILSTSPPQAYAASSSTRVTCSSSSADVGKATAAFKLSHRFSPPREVGVCL